MKRAAIEQYRVNTRTTPQEIGKVPSDRTIGRIGKPPLLQGGLCAVRMRLRVALGEETIEQHRLDLSTRELSRTHSRDQAGPATGQRDREGLVRPAFAGERFLLQISATGDQVIPLSAREFSALTDQSRFEKVCDREIDIVAAQQDVVAHCLALDSRGRAAAVRAQFE